MAKKGSDEQGLYIAELIDLVQGTFRKLQKEEPSRNQLYSYLQNTRPLVEVDQEKTGRGKIFGDVGTFFALAIYFFERKRVFDAWGEWKDSSKVPRLIVLARIEGDLGEGHPLLASYATPEEKPETGTSGANKTEGRVEARDNHWDEKAFLRSVDSIFLEDILRKMELTNLANNIIDPFSIQRVIDRGVVWDDSFEAAMLFNAIFTMVNRYRRSSGLEVRLNGFDEASFVAVFNYTRDFQRLMKESGSENAWDLFKDFSDRAEEARKVEVTPV